LSARTAGHAGGSVYTATEDAMNLSPKLELLLEQLLFAFFIAIMLYAVVMVPEPKPINCAEITADFTPEMLQECERIRLGYQPDPK
jgi:hypothetical protein